jgi:hypothetical protein
MQLTSHAVFVRFATLGGNKKRLHSETNTHAAQAAATQAHTSSPVLSQASDGLH